MTKFTHTLDLFFGQSLRVRDLAQFFNPDHDFQNRIIQLNEMYTELKRLEKQIAYDDEEGELLNQLAWARVNVSERESATIHEQIAKKQEVVRLLAEFF